MSLLDQPPPPQSASGTLHEPSELGRMFGEVAYYREHNPGFGPYLRKLREDRGVSLRDAASQLGISFAKLQKMETGGRFRIDSLQLFEQLADLFARPRREVLAKAGIRLLEHHEIADEPDEDVAFARLMLHPSLRPLQMDERWLESFSVLQKRQIVQFAKKLRKFYDDGGSLDSVLIPEEPLPWP